MEMEEITKEPETNVAKDEGTSATKVEAETEVYSRLESPSEDVYEFVTESSKEKAGYFQGIRLWRRVSACLGAICLILILVIVVLIIKLQNGSSVAVCQPTRLKSLLLEPPVHKRHRLDQCAPGWLQFGESCFFLSTLRKTWDEAKTNCSDMSGDLAVITSPSMQKFLTESGRVMYWIGLRHNTWVDGRRLTQSYWSDTSAKGACVLLQGNVASDKSWIKSSCTRPTYYICERSVSNN